MTYLVEETPGVQTQLATMPRAGLLAYAKLRERLAEDPWDGALWNENPGSNMRQAAFGDGEGLTVYVIVENPPPRVVVIRVLWAG